ncbi:hypothetical protein DI487_15600 [Flavobacterium sediminis]|uniref:Transporter n=2 Tax=Flavobacterium sediminis TaxID=2201181 RepID=A0A2U8QYG0_9FLAO|nr:hypothetical protein DI487_15600 [Flavobacterium sediminis]
MVDTMENILKSIAVLFLLCIALETKAQVNFSSLEEVLRYADEHEISIRSAGLQEKIYTSESRKSKMALLPSVNAQAGYNDNITLQPTLVPSDFLNPSASSGTYQEFTFGRKYVYTTGFTANWDILDFQKWFAVKTAKSQQEKGSIQRMYTRYSVYNLLANTYYSILLSEKSLEIQSQNYLIMQRIYKNAENKYKAGIISQEALNRAHIQLLQVKNNKEAVSHSLQELYNDLQSQLGIEDALNMTEELTYFGQDNDIEGSFTEHPEVVLQQAELKITSSKLQEARAAQFPSLSIGYQYNYSWATDSFMEFQNANELPQQILGLKLTVPILNGSTVHEQIRQMKISQEQQKITLEAQKLKSGKEDENLILAFNSSKEELENREEIVSLQSTNDRHTDNQYESGIISLEERLDRFQDLLNVQNDYLQSFGNYCLNYYKLYIRNLNY